MKIKLLLSADEMNNFQSWMRWFQMYSTKASLHLRRACLFPHQLELWIPEKCSFVSQCLQSYPSYWNVITKKIISMSATPSMLLISICSGSLSHPQTTPANVTISYPGCKNTHTHIHTSHCTANTITFGARLQMPLGLQATNHTFFSLQVKNDSVKVFTPVTWGLRQMCTCE